MDIAEILVTDSQPSCVELLYLREIPRLESHTNR